MKSIRALLRAFRWLKHKQCAVKGVAQGSRPRSGAAQISDLNGFPGALSISALSYSACNKANIYKPEDVSEVRSNLEGNNWSSPAGNLNQVRANLNSVSARSFGHRSILLHVNENGEAYDLTGQKWSRA